MEYKAELKLLRQRVPISMVEALQLLEINQGKVDLSARQFIEKTINAICSQTGCNKEIASERLLAYKYDTAKAIYSIREQQYTLTYIQPAGVTKENLLLVVNWLDLETSGSFDIVLEHEFDQVIDVLEHIPSLHKFVDILKGAKARQ
jgi:hypothetical protein